MLDVHEEVLVRREKLERRLLAGLRLQEQLILDEREVRPQERQHETLEVQPGELGDSSAEVLERDARALDGRKSR